MSTIIKRNATGNTGARAYKYSSLDAVNTKTDDDGIEYYQFVKVDEVTSDERIYTVVKKKGEKEFGDPIPGCKIIAPGKSSNAAQDYGSALTYARRYSLLMALGWACEDDDDDAQSVGKVLQKIGVQPNLLLDLKNKIAQAKNADQVREICARAAKWPNIQKILIPLGEKRVNEFKSRPADVLPSDEEVI